MTDRSQSEARTGGRGEARARRRRLAEGRRVDGPAGPDRKVYVVRAVTPGARLEPEGSAAAYGRTEGLSGMAPVQQSPVAAFGLLGAPLITGISTGLGRVFGRGRWNVGVIAYSQRGHRLIHQEDVVDADVDARVHELAAKLERHGEAAIP